MKRLLIYIFFFLCLFPFLDFLKIGTDTQPNALFFSVVPILICFRNKVPSAIYLFGFVLLSALVLLCFQVVNFNSLRDVANYASLFFVTLGTYFAFTYVKKLNYLFFVGVNFIWLCIGIVQSFFYPKFMTFLLNGGGRGIDSEVRGVTSIATEPSQYGTICIILALIAIINYPIKKSWWLVGLALFQLVVLAQSATALLTLVVAVIGFLLFKLITFNRRAFSYALVVGLIGITTFKLTYDTLKDQRMYNLAEELIENPRLFLAADGSVSERFMFVFYSFKGMVDNNFIPRGYNQFDSYMQEQFKLPRTEFTNLILYFTRSGYTRILSGLGSVVFQLGLIGLLVPLGIVLCFPQLFKKDSMLFSCIAILCILLTAFPIMTSILGFLLGNALAIKSKS